MGRAPGEGRGGENQGKGRRKEDREKGRARGSQRGEERKKTRGGECQGKGRERGKELGMDLEQLKHRKESKGCHRRTYTGDKRECRCGSQKVVIKVGEKGKEFYRVIYTNDCPE